MTEQTEINPLRAQMVRNIIAQHEGEPITVENLAPFLPADFQLGDDDLQQYQAAARVTGAKPPPVAGDPAKTSGEAPAPATGEPVTFDDAPAAPATGQMPVIGPTAAGPDSRALAEARDAKPPVPLEPRTPKEAAALAEAIESAVQRRIKADQELANRRVELMAAGEAERAARTRLSVAVTTFQNGFAPVSPEQMRRDYVREQNEIRAAIKDGRLPPRKNPGHGKSMVDRQAFYGRGGNPAAGNYRRGAYPSQAFGAPNYDPRRGNVAKPPSEL